MGVTPSDNTFIHSNFLLETKSSIRLYHEYAKELPIIDYHNHLSPKAIAQNTVFNSITQLWLEGDHYKWRALRTLGIDEKYITGTASDQEKFVQYASAVPYMIRNPLYHWTHLELERYFGISALLTESNAIEVFQETNTLTTSKDFSTQSLLKKMKVESLCTTDDPLDTLEHHKTFADNTITMQMLPTFRPDKSILIHASGFNEYVHLLELKTEIPIKSFDDLCEALQERIDHFHTLGCRLSDHGLEYIPFREATQSEIDRIFAKRREEKELDTIESEKFQTALLLFLGKAYQKLGWVQQFHLGAMRNNNSRMFQKLGPDTGWDSIGQYPIALSLSKFLNALDLKEQLPKTILYNLNPADNEIMATLIGNFNDGSSKGKVQWGSGWWFLDQIDGMTNQINTLSNMGIISCFVGMLTDSRSFLSFPRHEYFRRLLCNLFGNDIEKGHLPNDLPWIGKIVSDICYYNAKNYFDFK
ncbi:glucuronate isomerase [Flavobacteriaceae bacterium]|jgi:glucuronate isomerase|nr:glucuronate isomerase [Flavobacteriaceae bacterium]MDA9038017.1 glucuronate isomerase [Flavobacteriaceae bacterium]